MSDFEINDKVKFKDKEVIGTICRITEDLHWKQENTYSVKTDNGHIYSSIPASKLEKIQ